MRTLVFDTETDGLIPNSLVAGNFDLMPRIMEIYAEIIEEGSFIDEMTFERKVDVLDELVSIGRPIDKHSETLRSRKRASDITGIRDKDLEGKPSWDVVGPRFASMVAKCDRVVAHNLQFDMAVVDSENRRIGLPAIEWPQKICTVEHTEHLDEGPLSLTALHENLFGEPFRDAHRASIDVDALIRCYIELRERGIIYANV